MGFPILIRWHFYIQSMPWSFSVDKIDGLVQDCSNSSANTLELLQSCTKPLRCTFPSQVLLMSLCQPSHPERLCCGFTSDLPLTTLRVLAARPARLSVCVHRWGWSGCWEIWVLLSYHTSASWPETRYKIHGWHPRKSFFLIGRNKYAKCKLFHLLKWKK